MEQAKTQKSVGLLDWQWARLEAEAVADGRTVSAQLRQILAERYTAQAIATAVQSPGLPKKQQRSRAASTR